MPTYETFFREKVETRLREKFILTRSSTVVRKVSAGTLHVTSTSSASKKGETSREQPERGSDVGEEEEI